MYPFLKRALDIGLALVSCFLFAPIVLFISLILLFERKHPVIFTQTRIGVAGKPFTLLKFRTLAPGEHSLENPAAYATPFTLFLRQWGLDELPQLVNILRGDMSFVGPRPALPHQVSLYGEKEKHRLSVLPGLTGLAQIMGRNKLSWAERIDLDLDYIERRSFLFDLLILARTPFFLMKGRGTYGPEGKNQDFISANKAKEKSQTAG